QRSSRLSVPGVGEQLALDPDSVSVGPAAPVIELDRLVLVAGGRALPLSHLFSPLEPPSDSPCPNPSPADLPESLEPLLDPRRPDERDRSRVHEDAVQDESRQTQRVVAV